MHRLILFVAALAACQSPSTVPSTGHPPAKAPPVGASGGFHAELPPITVEAGKEVWPCFLVPIELEGDSRMVAGGTVVVGPGLHHGNVLTHKKTGDGIRTCPSDKEGSEVLDVAEGGALLFGSSTQTESQEWLSFPTGMAFRIDEGYEIVARMHYVNASTAPITVAPRYDWYTIPEAAVAQELAPFLWIYRPFVLPAHEETTVESTCPIEREMHIVSALPHTHARGIDVHAEHAGGVDDGKKFLVSPGYDPERGTWIQYDDPATIAGGSSIKFSCTFRNDTDKTIEEGPSGADEMCMVGGYAYPPQNSFSALAQEKDLCATVAVYTLK